MKNPCKTQQEKAGFFLFYSLKYATDLEKLRNQKLLTRLEVQN